MKIIVRRTFFAADFEAEVMKSKSGSVRVVYKKAERESLAGENNLKKNYILSPEQRYDFLVLLGIQDENGRIHDKKQSKFRQINKFLEIISDVVPALPEDKVCIWDLCCGKSYLSFAAYYYFTFILRRETTLYGADLKADVISYCKDVADKLGWDGMKFVCGDISSLDFSSSPDMVLSLHACDIATDIVLAKAVKAGAKVILSSSCCQHELSGQLDCPELSYITDEPILKQRLSAIITDALRCKLLYACGYKVTTLEFIDPEETPKNLMIRAQRAKLPYALRKKALDEYDELCVKLSISPTMRALLTNPI